MVAGVDGESGGGVSFTAALGLGLSGEISEDDEIFLLFAELTSGLALLLLF